MDLAIQAVQSSLGDAYDIVAATNDPASPEILAADRQVALSARQVLMLSRTLAAAPKGESKQLPGSGPADAVADPETGAEAPDTPDGG